MIKFACPSCHKSMRVDDSHAGKKGKCPKCGETLIVPERSTLIEFDCGNCGHTIKVAHSHTGKKGACPKCKHAVQVPEGDQEIIEATAPDLPDAEDDDYKEEASDGASPGPDRRLVWIIAGTAAITLVVILGLAILFWPEDSPPVTPPVTSQDLLETEQQDSNTPAPLTSDQIITTEVSDQAVSPKADDATHLTFNPGPGLSRTMRATAQLVMSHLIGGHLQETTSTQAITVDLKANEATADGTFPVEVTIVRIQVKTEMQGISSWQYDSAKTSSEADPMAEHYAPFIDKQFTIHVSRQGNIVNTGLDELYLTVAKDHIEAEDSRMGSVQAIERTDQRFGSRDKRIQAIKKQLEEFPLFGHELTRRLLGDLIVLLPSEPLENGMSWDGTMTVRAEMNRDVPATYSVTSLDESTCTIKAHGERPEEDPPFVHQVGQATITSDLAGSSQMTLIMDRHTGWLKSKTQKSLLKGQMQHDQPGQTSTQAPIQIIMDATTTVELVE